MLLKDNSRQFPENPVASDPHCHCESTGSTPGGRTKIPEVLTAWHGQKEKKKSFWCLWENVWNMYEVKSKSLSRVQLFATPWTIQSMEFSTEFYTGVSSFSPLQWNMHHFSSVTQSCPTLWDPMDCSTPGFPVHHQLWELIQTHVHWVGDAIQSSHLLSSLSPPAFNLSQHQGLFQWVSSSYQVAKKYWSFSFSISPSNEYSGLISLRIDWLDLLLGLSRVFSNTTVQKHQFFHAQLSLQSNSHSYMTTGKTIALTR